MQSTKEIGDAGEDLAVNFLSENNYKIITRNYRTRHGEIDIVAKEGSVLVFVEVKRKTSARFGLPAEMVTKKKLNKVQRMAEFYVSETDYSGPWRIDVVAILGDTVELMQNVTG